jgi:hypothetical protein
MTDTESGCDHGVTFDQAQADKYKCTATEIRRYWPRLFGLCPKGCGYNGIAYHSTSHYVYGDW